MQAESEAICATSWFGSPEFRKMELPDEDSLFFCMPTRTDNNHKPRQPHFQTMKVKLLALLIFCMGLLMQSCPDGDRSRRAKTSEATETEATASEAPAASDQPAKSTNYPDLKFKFYVERSGSMLAYDSNNSKGEFKTIITKMLNNLPTQATDSSLYIVNDNVYPMDMSVREFISERDMFARTAGIGNAGYTDFAKIFSLIMQDLKDNEVAILYSDLIYSVENQENVNVEKLLNEAQALTHNVFAPYHNKVDVTVVKFTADYSGAYYPYNSPHKSVNFNGSRPFYAVIFADHRAEDNLLNNSKYSTFMNFGKYGSDVKYFSFFSEIFDINFTFPIEANVLGKQGSFRIKEHNLTKAKANNKGEFAIPVLVNLKSIPLSDNYKTDKSNYTISSEVKFEIASITPVSEKEYTHVILLKGKPFNGSIEINMKYGMPRWIEQESSTDDTNLNDPGFENSTFAFKNMMEGIFNAYTNSGAEHNLFTLKFNIEK